MITLEFPDGLKKEYKVGTSVIEVAKSISSSLAKKVIAGKYNGEVVDTSTKIDNDGKIVFLTTDDSESLEILNHSTAHIMAAAVTNLFPNSKFGVGPSIEEGFYYDIDSSEVIKEEDLSKIEKQMNNLIKKTLNFVRKDVTINEVRVIFKEDEYKQHIIDKIEASGEICSVYESGDFVDLCRGVHVPSTKFIKNIKLLSIAGAYWLGDSNNKMLQRIYGVSFFEKDDLNEHLQILAERKERDHRKLGKELGIFTFSKETGQGLPLWLPKGAKIRHELEHFVYKEEVKRGYEHVYTPTLGTKGLYEVSGHWDHYQDDMFAPIEMDNETFVLRPMTCPHHMMIFKSELRSYRDLPLRIAERAELYRYESSGALIGLERVRSMNLADGHIFCRPDQIEQEFTLALDFANYIIETLGLNLNYLRLSLRDPKDKEKYFDDDKMWNESEKLLKDVLTKNNVNYIEAKGEAAFYGPKLDIQIKTALGHDITLGTIQLDFLLPQRFDLSYVDDKGEKTKPVVIHRGVISTMERIVATLLEQNKGAFPTWLSPVQVQIIPVSLSAHEEYVNEVCKKLLEKDVRVKIDNREEKLNYKIRESQVNKIPFTLILGDDESNDKTVTVRLYGEQDNQSMSIDDFITEVTTQIKTRKRK